jgi:membrane associated rhomboid family serine protease
MAISPAPPSPERPHDGAVLDAAGPPPFDDEAAREEAARLGRLQARLARNPWVTWALIGSISAMFGGQALLGGIEDPFVMIRLGGLVPERVLGGEVWRVVSSAFLHSGFMHFALNTYVLYVVGTTLERIVGSARFLLAYTVSVLAASAASLVLSDAGLTVGASGGVFGLFGVEAVVVFLRPDLLPEQLRARHMRTVVINLLINVANSFRPNIAMAAHFGGGVAGALVGLVLVPHRLDDRPEAAWAKAGAVLSALVLAAGVGVALFDAMAGPGSRPPTLARVPLELPNVSATAELPANLPRAEGPGTFGSLSEDPAVVVVAYFDGLAPPDPRGVVAEAQDVQAPEGTAFGAGRAEVVRGAPAAVLTYVGDRVPVRLERVLVREQSAAWLVEVAYWSSAESAYGGLALRVAESIEVSPDPSGE